MDVMNFSFSDGERAGGSRSDLPSRHEKKGNRGPQERTERRKAPEAGKNAWGKGLAFPLPFAFCILPSRLFSVSPRFLKGEWSLSGYEREMRCSRTR
ncbi:MAG: hypothetical protein D6679_10760 [Candidatus Hydrogenedentota bacterium]|nr:MAG: hypothetical protein D6679_10760 [Candidatus Hydrogenedentota bacterium]